MRDAVDVALVQLAAQSLRRETNVAAMVGEIRRLASAGPTDLIVFPELCTTGYVPPSYDEAFHGELRAQSETVPGSTSDVLGAAARAADVHVVYGTSERGDDGTLYNSAVLLTSEGEVAHVARKVHLWREEVHYFTAADRIDVVDTDLGRVGISVCYDSMFPELARSQALADAELLVCVLALVDGPRMPWTLLHRTATRAMENSVFYLAANRSGADATGTFSGGSVIAGPTGEVLASAADGVGVVRATLRGEALRTARAYADPRMDRRPDVYGVSTERIR